MSEATRQKSLHASTSIYWDPCSLCGEGMGGVEHYVSDQRLLFPDMNKVNFLKGKYRHGLLNDL